MLNLVTEGILFAITAAIFGYLWWKSRAAKLHGQRALWYTTVGAFFMVMAVAIDVTGNFSALGRYFVLGDAAQALYLMRACYLIGAALVFVGIYHWLPLTTALRRAERDLRQYNTEMQRQVEEIKETEQALHQANLSLGDANRSLEDRVRERTSELEKANLQSMAEISERKQAEGQLQRARDAALKASQAKSEFLSNMSHEIRTPMNAIIGMSDLLSETPLDMEQQEYVRVSRTAGDTLMTLINDILDLSKVEAGKVNLEAIDFDLGELVENTAEFFGGRSHSKGLELNCHLVPDVPTALIGDPLYLRQVLTNLVSNAIKFTEKGEVVLHIESDPEAKEAGHLLFRVSDTGIGMPQEKLGTIFDHFAQAEHSTTREYGGTGLGLSISRRLVELMGGRIWVESAVGEGSTFYFTGSFGIQPEHNGHVALPLEDMRKIKTLIVDDNATNRTVVGEMLASWGLPSTEVEDGYQALVEIVRATREEKPYRLVLLDRHMPGQDGFQVAKSIRDDLGISDITILMLTSDNRGEDAERCQQLGISRYLIKPVKRSELLHTISTCMGLVWTQAEEPMADEGPGDAEDQRPLRILLVDDSTDNRLLIQAYLKKTAYRIDVAENGEIAVERFTSGDYDLVLMDMQMPVMDGYSATRAIRKWERENGKRPTPIIGLTAYALKEDTEKSIDVGCWAHITKPIKRTRLMEVIYEHTGSVKV